MEKLPAQMTVIGISKPGGHHLDQDFARTGHGNGAGFGQ